LTLLLRSTRRKIYKTGGDVDFLIKKWLNKGEVRPWKTLLTTNIFFFASFFFHNRVCCIWDGLLTSENTACWFTVIFLCYKSTCFRYFSRALAMESYLPFFVWISTLNGCYRTVHTHHAEKSAWPWDSEINSTG
jgi:hypothetical protein